MVGGLTVFGNRALTLTLWKKTPLTYTFSESLIVIEYNHIFEIFLKVNAEVILKEIPRNTASFKLVRFRAWIIGAARLTSEMFSHTSSHINLRFSICGLVFFFYNLSKFDIFNADVPFCKRGHNLVTEAKLNKARHPFSNEVSLNVGAHFQLIPSKTRVNKLKMFTLVGSFILSRKRRKTFHEIVIYD